MDSSPPPAAASDGTSEAPGDDALLVARARDGDGRALATLLERYRPALIALATHVSGDREDALDAVQEASFKAIRRLGELADGALFYPWMRGIVRNHCLDGHRSRKRNDARKDELARRGAGGPVETPEHAEGEITEAVIAAILELPQEYHAPLFCRFIEEASYAQIATRTGRTVTSIRGMLYRGTKLLRDKLQHFAE